MMDTKQKIDGIEITTSFDEAGDRMCKAWFVGKNDAQYKEFGFGETDGEAIDAAIQACKNHPMWTPQVVETPAAPEKYAVGQRVKIVCSDTKPYQGAIGTIDIVYPDDRQGYDYRVAVDGMHRIHFDHDELTPLELDAPTAMTEITPDHPDFYPSDWITEEDGKIWELEKQAKRLNSEVEAAVNIIRAFIYAAEANEEIAKPALIAKAKRFVTHNLGLPTTE